jgi:Asp/Glu/hydantoin racemase
MTRSVTLIHTVASLVPTFGALTKELAPGVDVFHVVDESLLTMTRRLGRITPQTRRRLLGYATAADDLGVDAILLTCSSVGPVVEEIRPFLRAPMLRVDEAMADEAVARGTRIGVLATLRTTLEPTRDLILARARAGGGTVDVEAEVVEGAFEAVTSGDLATHDAAVGRAIQAMAAQRDIVVLAQASMARVLDGLGSERPTKPVLSSPRLAVERLAATLSASPVA